MNRHTRGGCEANPLLALDTTITVRMGMTATHVIAQDEELVVKPLVQCLDLIHCERRIDVIDVCIRR